MLPPVLLLIAALHGAGLRVVSTPGGQARSGDTLVLSLAPGDTAILEGDDGERYPLRDGRLPGVAEGSRIVLAPIAEGTRHLRFGRFLRRSWPVRLDVLPRRTIDLALLHAGGAPLDEGAMRAVEAEVDRLLRPLRTRVRLTGRGVLAVPSGRRPFWDRDGDGFLDLRRNMDSARPDAELDSLVRWAQANGATEASAVVVGLPSRTGWTLGQDLSGSDSVLVLDRRANLPWRDETGALRTYRVGSRSGDRSDTFQVLSYRDGSHRVHWSGTGPRGPRAHPAASDWVTLPGFDPGPFGFTPWWRGSAPILVFPSTGGRLPERSLARILAREVAHGLGLEARPEGRNLMCPMVRPDVADPVVEPSQWRVLLRSPVTTPPAR